MERKLFAKSFLSTVIIALYCILYFLEGVVNLSLLSGFKIFKYNAPVILTFTFLSFLVLLLSMATNNQSNILLFSVYRSSWTDPLAYVRIFLHIFGHVNWEHYFNNFLIILLVGPMIEEKYGSKNLLLMILFTAVLTGALNLLISDAALLGASGVVFMLILLSSYVNIEKGRIPLTLVLVIIIFIGREAFDNFFTQDNISHITHIIGGICGGIFGFLLNRKTATTGISDKGED